MDCMESREIDIPAEIDERIEAIAERIHEAWRQQRIADGWSFGPVRDDDRKQHPSLVPYDDLDDAEQEYDRLTARETIRTLLEMGYRIERA